MSSVLLGLLVLLVFYTEGGSTVDFMRAAKCVIPNGLEHVTRAALFQQCISKNYGQGNETQCYGELGCFPLDKPWTTTTRPLPSPLHPAEINVRLYGYTRASPERYNVTLWPNVSLNGCPLHENVAFITHGFASTGNSSWLSDLKDLYLKAAKDEVTVFLVDWGQGAQLLNYLQVASNTRIVGAELARFIKVLKDQHGLKPGHIHLMGHSLGAQISGYVGNRVPGIQRITGMDPAQPGFETEDEMVRLGKEDAEFVEVIHTNAVPFIPLLGFGTIQPHGHVDFYMNGGLRQPGCQIPELKVNSIEDLAKIPVEVLSTLVACSHGRAYEYFSHVLQRNCSIWGRKAPLTVHIANAVTLGYIDPLISKVKKCTKDSCIPLGLNTPYFKARGVFAAITRNSPPYCDEDIEREKRILSEINDDGEAGESSTAMPSTLVKTVDKTVGAASRLPGKIGGLLNG